MKINICLDISIRKILHTESERSTKEMEIVANEEGVTKQLRKLKEENSILNKKLKGMQRLVEKKDEMEAKVVQLEKICTNLVERYTKNKESPKVIQVPSNEMEAKLNKLQEKVLHFQPRNFAYNHCFTDQNLETASIRVATIKKRIGLLQNSRGNFRNLSKNFTRKYFYLRNQ